MTSIASKKSVNEADEVREIVMVSRFTEKFRENPLAVQKLAGVAALFFIAAALIAGGGFAGAAILAPMAFSAIFSKQKLMDFGIFAKSGAAPAAEEKSLQNRV